MTSRIDTSTVAGAPVAGGRLGRAHGRQRPGRPGRPRTGTDAELQRRGVEVAVGRHDPAPRLERELVAGQGRERTAEPERQDPHHARTAGRGRRAGPLGVEQLAGVEVTGRRPDERDIGPGQHPRHRRRRRRDAALAGGQEREQRAGIGRRPVGIGRVPTPQRVAAVRPLDLDHRRALVGQQLGGVADRDALTDLRHPQVPEPPARSLHVSPRYCRGGGPAPPYRAGSAR